MVIGHDCGMHTECSHDSGHFLLKGDGGCLGGDEGNEGVHIRWCEDVDGSLELCRVFGCRALLMYLLCLMVCNGACTFSLGCCDAARCSFVHE